MGNEFGRYADKPDDGQASWFFRLLDVGCNIRGRICESGRGKLGEITLNDLIPLEFGSENLN